MFDISGEDIAKLDDKTLRELVGLLCEAEFRNAGLDSKSVTWGGDQNAPDGGFDVVVRSSNGVPDSTLLKRPVVGIQVKMPDLQPADIKKEMCPGGSLRPDIVDLVSVSGCYLIVSSHADTSNAMLQRREGAMRAALAHEDPGESVQLQFLDRSQLATWVRQHPSMVLWVRERVGRPLTGWYPYGNWANTPGGVEEEYLADGKLRLSNEREPSDEPVDVRNGIAALRDELRLQGACLRLAGLSGVGKTRLVQALFDERVGTEALPKNEAYYCDVGDNPQPPPKLLIENLVAFGDAGIVVVDNCPPDLHASLREVVSRPGCCVSLLTVEYDVREDLPTHTGVYLLESASLELTERLVRKRFDHITAVDAQTIAEFSGGNARIAIALAETVNVGETLSGLRDETLLERLFVQRNSVDQRLQRAAETLSLVYSFDGEDTDPSSSELAVLGSIIGEPADEMFGHVATLRERKLAQSRSKWRAVLPHALANRLASNALKRLPTRKVVDSLLQRGSERLIKSFTRRLTYLHDSQEAQNIASSWLDDGGWIGDVGDLNRFGTEILKNAAPIAPERALEAIERSVTSKPQDLYAAEKAIQEAVVRILRSIAHDRELFPRCCALLREFALESQDEEVRSSTTERLTSLFPLYLSGTKATLDQRLEFIRNLSCRSDPESNELAVDLLDAALEATHFTSDENFDFGARPRDYGYRPNSQTEVSDWYRRHLAELKRLALTSGSTGGKARKVLRQRFRGLWSRGGIQPDLGAALTDVQAHSDWVEGWVAVKETIYFDSPRSGPDNDRMWDQLRSLEVQLRPATLVERARAYAFQDRDYGLDTLDDDDGDGEHDRSERRETVEEITRAIGRELANDRISLEVLLTDLVSLGGNRTGLVGEGLGENADDPKDLWSRLRAAAKSVPDEQRNRSVFHGYLIGLNRVSPDLCQGLLDELVDDEVFAPMFPVLQCAVELDRNAFHRLQKSIDLDIAPTQLFGQLAYGQSHTGLNDDELVQLLVRLSDRDDSSGMIRMILQMRLHGRGLSDAPETGALMRYCRRFICEYDYEINERTNRELEDYALMQIARRCFGDEAESEEAARQICRKLAFLIGTGKLYVHDIDQLLSVLAKSHPEIFLDAFLDRNDQERRRIGRFFRSDLRQTQNPMEAIDQAPLVAWCWQVPETRWLLVCETLNFFEFNKVSRAYEWKPCLADLIRDSTNLGACLEEIYESLGPLSWSGSRADILAARSTLLEVLTGHENDIVAEWATQKLPEFRQAIEASREWEARAWPRTEETFE